MLDNTEEVLKPDNQRIIKLAALFSSGGWALFEQELKEMRELSSFKIEDLTRQPVTDLNELNLAVCRRNALDMVFGKIAELQEEFLEEGAISPD